MPVTGRGALRPNRSLRAERAVSLACAALANRQIGFGRVRFALRPFPHRCVGAAPCGHFASLVRSIAAQSARLPSESFAFCGASQGANCAARGTGAFGRSVGVRACRRAARPAWGAPRIRRMRAIPLWRNTACAAWPRPGGAEERPAVRDALGRASASVPPLRARGTTFGLPYGASLTLAPTLRRRSAALPQDGCIYPVAQPR